MNNMTTIELDTSNPAPFYNYISIKEKRDERIVLGIFILGIISYFLYESYQKYNSRIDDN
jgi:hypothetical protein